MIDVNAAKRQAFEKLQVIVNGLKLGETVEIVDRELSKKAKTLLGFDSSPFFSLKVRRGDKLVYHRTCMMAAQIEYFLMGMAVERGTLQATP